MPAPRSSQGTVESGGSASTQLVREEWLEPLWQLFVDSGYFDLAGRSAAWFEEERAGFLALGRRSAHLSHLLGERVWPSARGVEATLSVMKPYHSTWMVHRLAKRRGGPGQALRELYVHAVQHALADSGMRWLGAYIEATVPFVHRTHVRFAQALAGTGRALLLPSRMMDVCCDEPSGCVPEGLSLGPATPAERVLLAEEIARTHPASYVEALDLGLEALDLEAAARSWREAGLERERQLLVARREGRPLAAAVLEVGQRGTNPFRLLDAARLFPLAPEGREAYVALLDEARRWYARRGRDRFIFLREDGDASYAAAARLHDAHPDAEQFLWLISAEFAPEFLQHLHAQTAGRLPEYPREGAVMNNLVKTQYLPHVLATRNRLDTDAALRTVLSPDISPALLERFLIEWSARGAYMTEPVEKWIRGAGERCIALGQEKLGQSLVTHAKHEADHHLMTIEDARVLVRRWNTRSAQQLDADALIAQPPTEAMREYRKLHDDTIASDLPIGQAAIELEVGYLAVELVPRILEQVARVLGQETKELLTFLNEHAAVDVGHTALNERMLEETISRQPECAQRLAEIGAKGLDCYLRFLEDCLRAAEGSLTALGEAA